MHQPCWSYIYTYIPKNRRFGSVGMPRIADEALARRRTHILTTTSLDGWHNSCVVDDNRSKSLDRKYGAMWIRSKPSIENNLRKHATDSTEAFSNGGKGLMVSSLRLYCLEKTILVTQEESVPLCMYSMWGGFLFKVVRKCPCCTMYRLPAQSLTAALGRNKYSLGIKQPRTQA